MRLRLPEMSPSSGYKLATFLLRQSLLLFFLAASLPLASAATVGTTVALPAKDNPATATRGVSAGDAQILKPTAPATETGATSGPKELEFKTETAGREMLRVITLTKGAYLHYDEEKGTIYSPERTRVTYKGMELEADQLDFNTRVREVTASGNVILKRADSSVHADSMHYNFDDDEGSAFNARAQFKNVTISPSKKEKPAEGKTPVPTFQRLSKEEVLARDASATGCDFVVPHYRVRAREILLIPNERIFFRSATLFVREIPVMYFPFYSRGLREKSPWFVRVGYRSKVGGWVRLGYGYTHQTQVPSLADPDKFENKSLGKFSVFADYLTQLGPGLGASYDYLFNYGRHKGTSEFYYMDDMKRDIQSTEVHYQNATIDKNGNLVQGEKKTQTTPAESTLQRYQMFLQHRSAITDDLTWIANVDYASDPELYDEVLDIFRDDVRKRVMEREARTAVTWAREHYVARLLLEVKDRIGRDRITNFSNPKDNDADFDVDANLPLSKRVNEAIPIDRWGTASQRSPQIIVETAWLRMWGLPFYFHSDLNVFNNLDKGLNTVDGSDDAWVQGADFYNSLMSRWRISPRYTALTKFGVGVGVAQRDNKDLNLASAGDDFPLVLAEPAGGLVLTDKDTFLIGNDKFNLDQVNPGFSYADFQERLNARFSDSLTGDLIYRYRGTTDDSLGEWYAKIGDNYVREDLYNFRLRENNIEGILRYIIANPRLTIIGRVYRNLVSDSELYPQELVGSYGTAATWENALGTLKMGPSIAYQEHRVFEYNTVSKNGSTYDDIFNGTFLDEQIDYRYSVNYRPVSDLWWTRVSAGYDQQLSQGLGNTENSLFRQDQSYADVEGLVGGRVGPKWVSELALRWDSRSSNVRDARVTFKRDLHDALLLMMVGVKQNIYTATNSNGSGAKQELDFRLALSPKLPHGEQPAGVPGISTLEDRTKTPEIEMAGEDAQTYQRY